MPDGRHITTADIIQATELSREKVSDALKKLKDKTIIARCIVGTDERQYSYFINPFLFVKGVKINATLEEMFRHSPFYNRRLITPINTDIFALNKQIQFFRLWQYLLPEIVTMRLTGAEMAVLLFIASHVQYNTSAFSHKNGVPYTPENIAAECGLKSRKVKEALKRFIELGFIYIDSDNITYVNPFLIGKGEKFDIQ